MKKVFNTILILVAVILPLALVSCSDSSSTLYVSHSNEKVSVNFTNKDPKTKSLGTSDTSINIYGVENCYWTYTASMTGNSLAVGTQSTQVSVTSDSSMGLGIVEGFEPGVWTFKLYAYKESGHSTLLYESKEIKKTLSFKANASEVTQINFSVSKVKTGGQGSIEIVTSGSDAITFKGIQAGEIFVLEDVAATNKDTGNVTTLTSISDYKATVDAGTYDLSIKFVYQGVYYATVLRVEVYSNFPTIIIGEMDAYTRQMAKYNIYYKETGGADFAENLFISEPRKIHIYGTATPLVDAQKDYYTFNGWSTDSSWTTSITEIDASVYEDTTVYAKWTPITYYIAYYDVDEDYTSYTTFTVLSAAMNVPDPAREGFTFNGWSTGTDTSATDTTVSSLTIAQGSHDDRSYLARWREHTYTIVFSSNTDDVLASGSMENLTKNYTDKFTLPEVGFTRSGWHFVGWSYTAGGDKALDNKANNVEKLTSTDLGVVTLYAVWAKNTDTQYKVMYYLENLEGNHVEDSRKPSETKTTVTDATVTIDTTAPSGFTYNSTSSTNSGIVKGDGSLILKLYYDRNSYSLSWDFDGGTLSGADAYTANGNYKFETPLTAPVVEKAGYDFTGWGNSVPEKMPTTNLNFKANWVATGDTPYRIEHYFENLSGSYVTDSNLQPAEEKTGAADTTATATFKEVEGFTKNDGMSTVSGKITASGEALTLKLYYDRNVHTLTWDFDGATATGNTPSGTYKYGYEITSPTSMEKTGYTFTSWSNVIPQTMPDNDVSIKANWVANGYKVKFDKNDTSGSTRASGSMTDQNRVYNETPFALGNSFARVGYEFDCWATKADGTGTTYTDTTVYNNLSTGTDVTLYAQWKANAYTLKFNKNKGSGSTEVNGTMSDQSRTFDDTAVALGNNFTRDGYTFFRWNTESDGSGHSYTTSTTYTNFTTGTNDVTLYAIWTANEYYVLLDKNEEFGTTTVNGECPPGFLNQYDGVGFVLDDATGGDLTRDGYKFVGWNTLSTGLGKEYTTNTTYTNITTGTDSIQLYAHWVANEYTLSFDKNKGTGSTDVNGTMTSATRFFDDTEVALGNNFTRDGYVFKEWNTKADGSGDSYTTDGNYNNFTTGTGEVKLYAIWTANNYTVKFDKNKGSGSSVVNGSMSNQSRTFDETNKKLTANAYSRDGYEFDCWATNANGSGTTYTDKALGNNLTTGTEITLYAQWKAKTYTITLDSSGVGETTSTVATFDSTALTSFALASTTNTDAKLLGYYTTTKTDGVLVITTSSNLAKKVTGYTDANGKWIRTSDATLYAKWEVNKGFDVVASTDVVLSFDSNGKFVAEPETSGGLKMKKGDVKVPYDISKVECIGKDHIIGFYTDTTFETKVLNGDGSVVTDTDVSGYTKDGKWACIYGEVTLYARWVSASDGELVIKFNANGGTGSMSNLTIPTPCSSEVSLRSNTFTNASGSFVGWNTKADGTGTWYGDGYKSSSWTGTELILYAQWTGTGHIGNTVSASLFMPVNKLVFKSGTPRYINIGKPDEAFMDVMFYNTACGGGFMLGADNYTVATANDCISVYLAMYSNNMRCHVDVHTAWSNGDKMTLNGIDHPNNYYDYARFVAANGNASVTDAVGKALTKVGSYSGDFRCGTDWLLFGSLRCNVYNPNAMGNNNGYCGGVTWIKSDGSCKFNLIPCVLRTAISADKSFDGQSHTTGEIGMWDIANDMFYPKASDSNALICELN